ncbi:DUF368 domain-containing protein [uncultured Dokdonia sp.]|uniref:DUF368 domain-containing protein n=1 Tax=uncultured Dokdonia sp. TaxID=575653 RepID=UPI00261BEEB9|nr:DUF368 domain-containing protein [uncultured Dokdonia sp.]
MSKSVFSYIVILLKGMAMGAADVVPGVSGGTIAFISGIYEELIETIDRLDFGVISVWRKEGFKKMFSHYNLGFLISLFSGVFISIISLANLISYLLENHPVLVWSFFFGLVVASIIYIGNQIKKWNPLVIVTTIIGVAIAYYITIATPAQAPDALYFFFLSGCIAIIAMILPGVSGSFILVLLGSYAIVLAAVTDFIEGITSGNWEIVKTSFFKVFLFIIGCIIGLKLFSKALKWMFANKKELTLAILTGFMIGSLNKIWPWKNILSTRIDRHGQEVPLLEKSVLPSSFEGEPFVIYATISAIIGFLAIFLLERLAVRKKINAN